MIKMIKACEEAEKHSARIMNLDEFIAVSGLNISVEEAQEE